MHGICRINLAAASRLGIEHLPLLRIPYGRANDGVMAAVALAELQLVELGARHVEVETFVV